MPLNQSLDLADLVDLLPDLVCAVGPDGTFLYVSAACEAVLGYRRDEMQGRLMLDFIHPEDRRRTLEGARSVIAGQPLLNFENRYLHRNGSVVHLMWTARWSERRQLRIAVARDVTARKRQELLHHMLYRLSEAVHVTADLDALYREIHAGIAALLPAANCFVALHDAGSQLLHFPYFVDEREAAPAPAPLAQHVLCSDVVRSGQPLLLQPGNRAAVEERLATALPAELSAWLGVPLRTESGVLGVLGVQSWSPSLSYTDTDRTLLQFLSSQVATAIERKQLYEQQEFLSLHDPLTGLPNRRLFEDRLEGALARGRRQGTRFVLLFVDLDDFKQVNDTLGHEAGDALLWQAGQRLLGSMRRSDTVARLGGDEFVLLLENLAAEDAVGPLQDKIRTAFASPFQLDGGSSIALSPSIGLAIFPEHGSDARSLLDHADRDMYRVKASS